MPNRQIHTKPQSSKPNTGSKTKLQKKMMCKTASNFNNGMNLTANTVKADAKPTTPVKNTAS
jgi:hypothetical protein